MEAIKNFFGKNVVISDGLSLQVWVFFAVAAALILLTVAIIISAKKNKTDENAAKNEIPANTETAAPLTAKEASKQFFDVIDTENDSEKIVKAEVNAESKAEPNKAEPKVEPKKEINKAKISAKPENIITSAVETKKVDNTAKNLSNEKKPVDALSEPEKMTVVDTVDEKLSTSNIEATEKEEKITNKSKVSENKATAIVETDTKNKATDVKVANVKPKTIAEKTDENEITITAAANELPAEADGNIETKDKTQIDETVADDDIIISTESTSDVAGKFTVVNSSLGGFRFLLLANNGQLLYESRDYKSKATCTAAIPKFQLAVSSGVFTAKKDKFDRYKFMLKPQGNVNTVYVGESFKQNSSCLKNIESVKRFINSPVVDRTSEEDIVSRSTAYVIPDEIVAQVNGSHGAKGVWDIAKSNEDDEKSPFVFLLYANNGQILYESKEYKSYNSCKSGLNTFVETVKEGVFIVDSDKAGRFKFVLRSNKVGSQAEYVGQFYRNKKACENSIDSVYKFALLSPTDNLK